ncbi:hypothetical protein HaLaN_29279, partial [Haematococcus lacustris]
GSKGGVTPSSSQGSGLNPPAPPRPGKRASQAQPNQGRPAPPMRLAAATVSAQPHTTGDPDQHQLPPTHPPRWRNPEWNGSVTPGGQLFWERGPDGRMRPQALYDSVVLKAIGRMRTFLRRKGRRDALSLGVDRNVFFIPMAGRLIAVYPKLLMFVIFSPN